MHKLCGNFPRKEGLRDAVKVIRKKAKLEAEWLASLKQELADRDEELARKESAEGDGKSPNSDEDPGQCKGGVSDDADKKSLRETPLAQGQVPNPKSDPKGKTQEPKKVPKKAPVSREDKSKRKTKVCWHYTYNLCKRKDAECDFIHPPACKKALQKKACFNPQCNLHHFRQEYDSKAGKQSKSKPSGNSHLSRENRNQKHRENALPQNQNQSRKGGRNGRRNGNGKNNIGDAFLGQLHDLLQNLIRIMQ